MDIHLKHPCYSLCFLECLELIDSTWDTQQ